MNDPLLPVTLAIGLAASLGLLAYLFVYYRNKIAVLKKELESKSQLASHYALQLESVQIDLKNSISFRERAISIVVHDLKSPLTFLNKAIVHLNESTDGISPQVLKRLTTEMSFTTHQIVGFVNDLLEWLKSNNKEFVESSSVNQLLDFVQNKYAIYANMAKRKGLDFTIDLKPDYYIAADFNLLQIVVRNLLDNALKNTDVGGITLSGYAKDGKNYIIISDTGNGMTKDKASELEYGVITRKTNDSTQIGFRIVHDLVRLLNGKISITTEKDKGTTVTLALPQR